jgi:uncharacterized Tic20 family protein
MFVTWQGRGLYAVLPFFTGGIPSMVVSASFELESPNPYSSVVFAIGILVGAAIVWFLGRRYEKEARVLIDPETREEVKFSPKNTFYYVSLKSWAIVWAVFGVLLIVSVVREFFG